MPVDLVALVITAWPFAAIVAVVLFLGAVFASLATATPGGMVPRTMDPAATWR
jgi:hypothetical protein